MTNEELVRKLNRLNRYIMHDALGGPRMESYYRGDFIKVSDIALVFDLEVTENNKFELSE